VILHFALVRVGLALSGLDHHDLGEALNAIPLGEDGLLAVDHSKEEFLLKSSRKGFEHERRLLLLRKQRNLWYTGTIIDKSIDIC